MRAVLHLFLLWSLVHVTASCHAEDVSPEMAENFRNHIRNANHVVLVCEVQKRITQPAQNGSYKCEIAATVVRTIKGKGHVGDRLIYSFLLDEKPNEEPLDVGNLVFLMLEDYGPAEMSLGPGDSWDYAAELDALLGRILNAKKKKK